MALLYWARIPSFTQGDHPGQSPMVAIYPSSESKASHSQCSMGKCDSWPGVPGTIHTACTDPKSCSHFTSHFPYHHPGTNQQCSSSHRYANSTHQLSSTCLPRRLRCPPGRQSLSHCTPVRDHLHRTGAHQSDSESQAYFSGTTIVHPLARLYPFERSTDH